jgi:hypothetical protein
MSTLAVLPGLSDAGTLLPPPGLGSLLGELGVALAVALALDAGVGSRGRETARDHGACERDRVDTNERRRDGGCVIGLNFPDGVLREDSRLRLNVSSPMITGSVSGPLLPPRGRSITGAALLGPPRRDRLDKEPVLAKVRTWLRSQANFRSRCPRPSPSATTSSLATRSNGRRQGT